MTLYNISNSHTAPANKQGHEKLFHYISSTALPKIDQSTVDSLNTYFSTEEIYQMIKALRNTGATGI